MSSNKIFLKKTLILPLIMLTAFFFMGAVRVYQTGTLKSDGSGTIKIIYSAKPPLLTDNKFIIGNFPFTEDLATQYFTSENTTVKKAKLDFNAKDSMYFITVDVDFTDINKISNAKGFSNIKASYTKTDAGMVFNYIILANPEFYKKFDEQSYLMTFDDKVKSTSNGTIKDKTVIWGNRDTSNSDFSKDIVLAAITEPQKEDTKNNNEVIPQDPKGKPCGTTGMELPLILVGGLVYSIASKKRKSK